MTFQTNLEIAGTLREHSLPELLVEISRAKLNGSLRLSDASSARKTVVYFDAGDAVFAVSNARRFRLSEVLLSENKISGERQAALSGVGGDLALRENLIKSGLLSKTEIDALVSKQIELILKDAFGWGEQGGEWFFSPLVRIKGDIHFQIDAPRLLVEYARNLPNETAASKFKDLRESFSVESPAPAHINLLPEEAFVFSRFETSALDVEEAVLFSGLPEAVALRIVYTLWLAGFLARARWSAPFSERSLDAIRSANLTLKKIEAAAVISEAKSESPVAASADDDNLSTQKEIPAQNIELTLEEYLERIETAPNYYGLFDIAADVPTAEVKRAYLALAKRFHPDLFQREAGADKFGQIKNAFTRIAQAYETLKNEKSREVYDYKMRKELAEMKTAQTDSPASVEEIQLQNISERAEQDFANGFSFLMDENFADALPFLARAAHLVADNARYRAYYGKALSADARQKHKAESEMQAAIRLEPNNADFRLLLAEFFVSMNLPKRAEGELNRLLSIFPGNKDAKLLLDSLAKR